MNGDRRMVTDVVAGQDAPVLLLHETIVGRPSPPARFLATVRLRKPCAISSVVLVPEGQISFEHAAQVNVGLTPRTPADVELLFNLQFAAPARPPPAHKANKLQKVVLQYRPTLEDSEGRLGSQEFSIDMPKGVSTNLLIFRSSLPVISVLVYGRPPTPLSAPPPEPDWSTYLRLRSLSSRCGGPSRLHGIFDPSLPASRLLAEKFGIGGWHELLAELAERERLSASATVTTSAQDELQDLVGLLVEQGKRVTACLSTTLQQPVDADETTPVEDDSVAALQLTLVHTAEVLRFLASRPISSHASLSISCSDLEVVLMGCLLLLATSDNRARALTLTADILVTLLSIAETKDTVVSRFADAVLSPEESSSTDKPSQPTSVWDLALWWATLSSTVDGSTFDDEDSKAFAALILNLVQTNSSSQPHFLEYSPTPRALLAFLSTCVQISTTAALIAERVGSAGAPPALLDENGLDERGQGLEESDVESLKGVLGEMLGLWVADRALAELCSTLLSRPAVFDALSLLSAHSSGPLSRSATSLSNIILSHPHCSSILETYIRRLPWSIRSSLTSHLDPLPALHLSIVAQAAPAQQVLLMVISFAKLLQSDLSDSTFFELQVWLVQLRSRVEILDDEPGFALLLSETQGLLNVFAEVTTVQRDLLARTGSFARDLQAGFDRVATFGTLGKVNTLVLECLYPFFRTTDTRRERERHHADRWLRRTLVERATTTLAESHLTATYALKPAFLDAFCRPNHRSSFELVVEGQLSQTRSLVWLLAGSVQSVQEDVEDVLSSLLEWTLRDPATTGSSTIELLAYVLRNLDLSSVGFWRKALRAQEMQLSLLALFVSESDRNELALTLQAIEPSPSDVLPRSPSSPTINLTALSSASSSPSTVGIPRSSLLAYFHSPVPPNDRHTTFSPSKAASQTFVGSPTTGKTYKQHEFRAPRGVGGAGGERVVSRAPSKHVDEMDPSFPFQPFVAPFPPSQASASTSMLGVSFTPS